MQRIVRSPLSRLAAMVGLLAALTACPASPPVALNVTSPGQGVAGSTVSLEASGGACPAPNWTTTAGTLDKVTGDKVNLTLPAASMSDQTVTVTATCGSYVTTTGVKVPAQKPSVTLNHGRVTALSANVNLDLSATASFGCDPADLKWEATAGTFSTKNGQVVYTAPNVTEDTPVAITAKCGTNENAGQATFDLTVRGTNSASPAALSLTGTGGVFQGQTGSLYLSFDPAAVPCDAPQATTDLGTVAAYATRPGLVRPLKAAPNFVFTPPAATNADQTATITVKCGPASATHGVTVYARPTIDLTGLDVDAIDGGTALHLTGTATSGSASSNYLSWTLTGGAAPVTASGATFDWTAPAPALQAQNFTLTVSFGGTTITRPITVKGDTPAITIDAGNVSGIVPGMSLDLTASLNLGLDASGLTWTASEGSFKPATGASVTYTAPDSFNPATTSVTITASGSVNGQPVTKSLTLPLPPAGPFQTAFAVSGPAEVFPGAASDVSVYPGLVASCDQPTLTATLGQVGTAMHQSGAFPFTLPYWTFAYTAPAATAAERTETLTARCGAASLSTSFTVLARPVVTFAGDFPASVEGGETVTLNATATSGGEQALPLDWTASGGTPTSFSGGSFTWTAPAATNQPQTVTITASAFGGTNSRTITVKPTPTFPVVTLSATRVDGLGTVNLTATARDGDTITWNATAGSFDSTTGGSVTWTAPAATWQDQPVMIMATAAGFTVARAVTVNAGTPVVTFSPAGDQIVPAHGELTVSAGATLGCPADQIRWRLDPINGWLSAASGARVVFTAPEATASAQSIDLTATCGSGSASLHLTVPAANTLIVKVYGPPSLLGQGENGPFVLDPNGMEVSPVWTEVGNYDPSAGLIATGILSDTIPGTYEVFGMGLSGLTPDPTYQAVNLPPGATGTANVVYR